MKFEKLTKENVCEVLNKCHFLSEKDKLDTSEHDFLKHYLGVFSNIDIHFPRKKLIATIKDGTYNLKESNVDEKYVLYRENGCYQYLYYIDYSTQKKYASLSEVKEDVGDFYLIGPSRSTISYFHYDEELDILICASYTPKLNNKHNNFEYKKDSRIYIFTRTKEKFVMDYSSVTKDFWYRITNSNLDNAMTNPDLLREFTKMFKQPIVNIGANKFVTIDTYQGLLSFLDYTAKLEIKSGPKQNKIDELVSIDLPDITTEVPSSFTGETLSTPYSKTVVQKVKENTCVIRWRLCSKFSDVECDGLRIYVEGRNIYPCKLNNANKFIRTTISNIKPENFLSCDMEEINKTDLDGTILQYYGEIINDIPTKYRSLLLILFVKEPKIEQIFKIGLQTLIYEALDNESYDVLSYVCGLLNIKYDKKEKNIFKYLGVNKYQLAKYKEFINKPLLEGIEKRETLSLIKYIKNIFGDDLSSIDNKTFDSICNELFEYGKKYTGNYWYSPTSRFISRLADSKHIIEATNNKNLIKHFNEIMLNTFKLEDINMYSDYIRMVAEMEDFKNFKIGFSDEKDVKEMHDAAFAVYNLNREEFKNKAFKAQLVKVAKLEYENKDDDFSVVIPKEAGDLAKEGLELHHCVKSYIDKVANGMTNIVFIRKKDDKTKPFFTVEVSNDKVIEQVHGFGNRNACTEPGLEDFVNRWAKNKRLIVTNINKIR